MVASAAPPPWPSSALQSALEREGHRTPGSTDFRYQIDAGRKLFLLLGHCCLRCFGGIEFETELLGVVFEVDRRGALHATLEPAAVAGPQSAPQLANKDGPSFIVCASAEPRLFHHSLEFPTNSSLNISIPDLC